MSSREDLVPQILKESYDRELNWENYVAPVHRASSFWHGLRHVFQRVCTFFVAQLRDGLSFQYWTNNWSTQGILSEAISRLFALSINLRAKVEEFWDGMRNPTLAGALSDQRVKEFMVMQQSLIYKRPQRKVRDGWEWIGAQFSIQRAYKRLFEGQYEESQPIIKACRFIWRLL